jgi:hypothetical protein
LQFSIYRRREVLVSMVRLAAKQGQKHNQFQDKYYGFLLPLPAPCKEMKLSDSFAFPLSVKKPLERTENNGKITKC